MSREELKERLLTQEVESTTRSIADASVIKHGDVFLVCDSAGDIPLSEDHGYGLYCDDCRWLDGYELTVAGAPPHPLVTTAVSGFEAVAHLVNGRGSGLPREGLSLRRKRAVEAGRRVLVDELRLENRTMRTLRFPLRWRARARFQDVFVVRGLLGAPAGRLARPRPRGRSLRFDYTGIDGLARRAELVFPQGARCSEEGAELEVELGPGQAATFEVGVTLTRSGRRGGGATGLAQLEREEGRQLKAWVDRVASIRSDSPLLNRIVERSLVDLGMLLSRLNGEEFFAAGLPWFGTLFGRDALISALQLLAFEPKVAEGTLRLLAGYQGKRRDRWTDEEPGRILHELRIGELARAGDIPHTPYYGTMDAPLLLVILLGRHAAATGRLDLFHELRGAAEAALGWADERAGGGWLAYGGQAGARLVHQGWKDAGGSIAGEDGEPADPPLALVEVQAYWYAAKAELAGLYRRAGEHERARSLARQAAELKARLNAEFWVPELGLYALALSNGRLIKTASSNAGHVLWAGAADEDKAARVAARLLEPDLFSGWGVRTLSTKAKGYNPLSYHRGSVWPHDNSLIAAGLRRYGFKAEALRLASAVLDAASYFPEQRLPELFCGLSRDEYPVPVPYPVACHPQAWAAASVPYLLQTFVELGELPPFCRRLEISGRSVSDGAGATERSRPPRRTRRGPGTRGRAARPPARPARG